THDTAFSANESAPAGVTGAAVNTHPRPRELIATAPPTARQRDEAQDTPFSGVVAATVGVADDSCVHAAALAPGTSNNPHSSAATGAIPEAITTSLDRTTPLISEPFLLTVRASAEKGRPCRGTSGP